MTLLFVLYALVLRDLADVSKESSATKFGALNFKKERAEAEGLEPPTLSGDCLANRFLILPVYFLGSQAGLSPA